ncbi:MULTISPECIES: hypothetical protein [Acinetobacter]|nr:hypothetical protein [Acinetobacter sp. HR7]KGT46627.1 hypothetical protein GW12_23670 [Acinetobacter sp. HR7]
MAQIANVLASWSESFIPGVYFDIDQLRFFDSRIDDGNTASIFKRLKSPERFTGGRAVHWM